jgi:hypothetical protein
VDSDAEEWAESLSLQELARQVGKAGEHLNDLYCAACWRAEKILEDLAEKEENGDQQQ